MPTDADVWRRFGAQFQKLSEEERTEEVRRNDRWLHAHCDYTGPDQGETRSGLPVPPRKKHGIWMLSGGISEAFRARFEALATRAGAKLDPHQDVKPLDFWMHCLFLDLRENDSSALFGADKTEGIINRVCEASATFCARLERRALEAAAEGTDVWNHIDHGLITMKMADLASAENRWFEQAQRRNRHTGVGANLGGTRLQLEIEGLGRWAERLWQIYEEVWAAQGNEKTPEFLRAVYRKAIAPAIDMRASALAERLRNRAVRTRLQTGLGAQLAELQRIAERLKSQWARKAEIAAIELEYGRKKGAAKLNVHEVRSVGQRKRLATVDPEVAKRRVLVRTNLDARIDELCQILDRQAVPLPAKWQGAGLRNWFHACRQPNYRSRIQVIFSKDRLGP